MKEFIESFNKIQKQITETAESKGWYIDKSPQGVAEKIALMHSELSEALESARVDDPPSDKIPEFSGMEEEFADTIIRIMHLSERLGLRVSEAIIEKDKFNSKRSYRHGNKKI